MLRSRWATVADKASPRTGTRPRSLRSIHCDQLSIAIARNWPKACQAPYELDHVFSDTVTHKCVVEAEIQVVDSVNGRDVVEFSDHAPVRVDFDRPIRFAVAAFLLR